MKKYTVELVVNDQYLHGYKEFKFKSKTKALHIYRLLAQRHRTSSQVISLTLLRNDHPIAWIDYNA